MSIFLGFRSKKGRKTSQIGEISQLFAQPERVSNTSTSLEGMINLFPSPPTISPSDTVPITPRRVSRQSSTLWPGHGNPRATDDEGLPFIPPSEIGGKFPTPTPGLSTTSLSVPHSQRESQTPGIMVIPQDEELHQCEEENFRVNTPPQGARENRETLQNLSPKPTVEIKSFSRSEEAIKNKLQEAIGANETIDWSPCESDQLADGEHLLYYGRSPSFLREQAAFEAPTTRQDQLETTITRPMTTSDRGLEAQRLDHGNERRLRVSSLPPQIPIRSWSFSPKRSSSVGTESIAGESNVALPSSVSETSAEKRRSKVVRTHPRYGIAYKSLTVDDAYSSSSTNLSTFQWAKDAQGDTSLGKAARHRFIKMDQRRSSFSDRATSQGFSDYADVYDDVPHSSTVGRNIDRGSSASGLGHKRHATPPLLFGTRAIGESARSASPPHLTRSNSRLVRVAEAAGVQQSGRLMRAITDSSERDWETVAETNQGERPSSIEIDNGSSYVNYSNSDSDMKSGGLPTHPHSLPQPAHPRYIQSWTLKKKLEKDTDILVPSLPGSNPPHDATFRRTLGDGHKYEHPTPLAKHTNPFNSSPVLPNPTSTACSNSKTHAQPEVNQVIAATPRDDQSVSNYSLYDHDPGPNAPNWVSTAIPIPSDGETVKDKSGGAPTELPPSEGKIILGTSVSAQAAIPKFMFTKSPSCNTGSSLADLSSSPTPAAPSHIDAKASSLREAITPRIRKHRTFDGSLTSIAVEAEERNPMRKYMNRRENSYQSVDEPNLEGLPTASRVDTALHEGPLARKTTLSDGPLWTLSRTPSRKRPTPSKPPQKLTSASSSVKEIIDTATARGSKILLPAVTPRSSFHGSPQNRAWGNGVTNSTAIELQPLSPPQAFHVQSRVKRRGTLLRLKRRKPSKSNPRSPPPWEDTTRHHAALSGDQQTQAGSSKHGRDTTQGAKSLRENTAKTQDGAVDHDTRLSSIPNKIDLSTLRSDPGNIYTIEANMDRTRRQMQESTQVAYLNDDPLASLRFERRSQIRPKAQLTQSIRPVAHHNSPHLHRLQYEYEADLELQKRFSQLLIATCLLLFPTLLLLGQPSSDGVVRMLSGGQASGFYRPYTVWTRSLAASLFSAGVAAIIVVACMGGFH